MSEPSVVEAQTIRELMRHAGSMCLIENVVHWDHGQIVCRTATHSDAGNPLRCAGELAALHLIEYCAQAMALHRGLVSSAQGERAPDGLLVSVRKFLLRVPRLDDLDGPITVHAKELLYFEGGTQYEVRAQAGDLELGGGRISVVRAP